MTSLTAEEVLRWNDVSAKHWRKLLLSHTGSLLLPCDVRGGHTVADLVQHIVAVELRYAEQLMGDPVTDYADIPKGSVPELFDTHDYAMAKYRTLLEDDAYNWLSEMQITTRSEGTLIATPRAVLFHALLHSIRHYAQLATLLRHEGIKADWPMDYLFMSARRDQQF